MPRKAPPSLQGKGHMFMIGDYSEAYDQLKEAQKAINELDESATVAECAAVLRINFHKMYQGMMLAFRDYEVANTNDYTRADGGLFTWARAELEEFHRLEQQCGKLADIRPVSALKEECVKYLGRAKFYIDKISATEALTNDYKMAVVPDVSSSRAGAYKAGNSILW